MNIQFKKGVLELCVLSMLKEGDQYGYDVASRLSQTIDVADGSIYLVLRRLKQDDYVTSYLEESSGGPPRKYYVITRKGEQFLNQLIGEWNELVGNVNAVITGGKEITEKANEIMSDSPEIPYIDDIAPESPAPVLVGAETKIYDGGSEND